MANKLSQRLADIVDALPLKEVVRVLEIGCGLGAAARCNALCRVTSISESENGKNVWWDFGTHSQA